MTISAPSQQATTASSPWPVFAMCSAAAFITTLDLSVVNVAFPEIVGEFGASRADVSWIVTTYNICFASLLVVAGKTADQQGRRLLFRIGVAVFAVGSIVCTFAPTLATLVVGRAVQGIGGALLTPASLGLLLAAFPLERRTQVVAMWGGVGALGVASGPSLGALFISLSDWRAAFWINLPICAVLLAASGVFVADHRARSAQRPDYLGAVMITAALAALAYGVSQSEVLGWTDLRTLGSIALALAIVPLFVTRQRRHPEPVLDLTLFRSRTFCVANAAGVVFFAGFAALGLNNVLFLRQAWGYTVLHAGLLSALPPLTVAVLAPFTGRLASRIGFRPFVIAGPLIVAAAAAAYVALVGARPDPWRFVAISEVIAVGIACFIPVNAAAAVSDLPPMRLSIGGAVNNTGRQVGAVLGVAMLVAVVGSPQDVPALVTAHHRGFVMIAVLALGACLVSLGQARRSRTAQSPLPR